MKRLALFLLLAACGAVTTSKPGRSTTQVAYPNGKARFEFELRDGLPNGRGRAWHPSGKLAFEGAYKDGARHGRFWFYDEAGALIGQAVYFDNAEVWTSTTPDESPPEEWTRELPVVARGGQADAATVTLGAVADEETPDEGPDLRPQFTAMDRTAVSRAGIQVGVGSAGQLDFGAATRVDMYGHYRRGAYGAFAQVSETRVAVTYMNPQPFEPAETRTLSGRRTLELGGTYHRTLRGIGALSARAGVLVPIANDDEAGFVASVAGAGQRPADAAAAFPSALTLRTGASLLRSRGIFVVQVDVGLDGILGGDEYAVDALARGNVGVGVGTSRSVLLAELTSAAPVSDPGEHMEALALGGALTFRWFVLSASLVFGKDVALVTTVGRDL